LKLEIKTNNKITAEKILFQGYKVRAFFSLFFFLSQLASGQDNNNFHRYYIYPSIDTLVLDTLSIIPETTSFDPDKPEGLFIDYARALCYFPPSSKVDSVQISYRTFSVRLADPVFHKSSSLINEELNLNKPNFKYTVPSSENGLITMDGLQKSGNISRGILAGNNRNASVTSDLNLQLSGKIAENIEILASITDNNIPIQPEGNTQQLQDFDKIFIQVFNSDFKLIAGDYEMIYNRSHFLKYNKKNLGLSFDFTKYDKNKNKINVSSAAALSKGKFARNQIQGQESLQGPYRLRGNQNESFIVVLSGTERVYIDGILLERGSNKDYVINYNSAEISFTPRILITKDKRITVEFQYSDRNYFRSLVQGGTSYTTKKTDTYINVYSEQDSKNQPLQQSLTEQDISILSSVGNETNRAINTAVDSTGYDDSRVMYALIDSLGYDSVFVVSNDQNEAVYQLSFSQLPQGQADYIQGDFTANGRTFVWVAPDTINGQVVRNGNYAPVQKLIAPSTHQMIVVGNTFKPDDKTEIKSELSYTHLDPNTFSSIDNSENNSWAGNVEALRKIALPSSEDNNNEFELFGQYEYIAQRFKPIERFRSVEFSRDWNIRELNDTLAQQFWEAGIRFKNDKWANISYSFRDFQTEQYYKGQNNLLSISLNPGIVSVNFGGSYLSTEELFYTTKFYRHKSMVSVKLKHFTIGVQDEFENNDKQLSDSLLSESYRFFDYKAFIESAKESVNSWRVYAGQRIDWGTFSVLEKTTVAANLGAEYQYLKSRTHRFNARLNYRELRLESDSVAAFIKPENNLLGRLEYTLNAGRGSINWNVFYEIGSGLDQLREYYYQEVNTGLGVYEWIDLNGNGIKELNEFFVSQNPTLANYILVYTPNNNYVRVYNAQFSQFLTLNPENIWREKQGILKFMSRFSTQTQYSVNKKTQNQDLALAYNPFYNPDLDSSLMSFNNTLRNTVFFNRSYTKYSMEYTYLNNKIKSLLLNGFQTSGKVSNFIKIRWNITQKYTLVFAGDFGQDFSASDFLDDRNFTIKFQTFSPEFRFQPSPSFRISLVGDVTSKKNIDVELDQDATILGIGLESRYNIVSKGSMYANVNLSNIDYTGPENTPSQVEMLETLRPGLNLTWSLTWQWNLTKYLQLSMNYNGRKSETAAVVHVGGIDLRAFF